MSHCLNPHCPDPLNAPTATICQSCGSQLQLNQRYRALKRIGHGGFGRTFLAVDQNMPVSKSGSSNYCVIKQLFLQSQGAIHLEKVTDLFRQEVDRLAQLGQHAQIPQLLAYIEQDQQRYLVQEFINGQNLAEELQEQGSFSEAQIRQLLHNLLPVLHFIHSRKVIHRDIKPDNIIRRRDTQQFVLVDFGAARFASGTVLARTGTLIGTAEFTAPEQVRGKAIFASDLYSLGVTCLHLLTGVSPFHLYDIGEDAWVWRNFLVDQPISESLGRILDRLVQNATRRRFQSAYEVIKALSPLQAELIKLAIGGTAELYQESEAWTQDPSTHSDAGSHSTSITADHSLAHLRQPVTNKTLPSTNSDPAKHSQLPQIHHRSSMIPSGSRSSDRWDCLQTVRLHQKRITSVVLSPLAPILLSSSYDQTVRIWNWKTKEGLQVLPHPDRVTSVALSPDGKLCASSCEDRLVRLWHLQTGELIYVFKGHEGCVNSVIFTPNQKYLISGARDSTIRRWDLQSGSMQTLTGHAGPLRSLATTCNSQILVSGSEDATVRVWDLESGQLLNSIGAFYPIFSVALSPNDRFLVGGGYDSSVKVWHLETGKLLNIYTDHANWVLSVAISPNGQILASGGEDYTIKVRDFATRRLLASLSDHAGRISAIAFGSKGRHLASGCTEGTLKIWRSV